MPEGNVVKLTFTYFKLESNCNYDYVEIKDGLDSSKSRVIAKLCGTQHNKQVQSTGRSMLVWFGTDGSVNLKGFRAVYYASMFEGGYNHCPPLTNLSVCLSFPPSVCLSIMCF